MHPLAEFISQLPGWDSRLKLLNHSNHPYSICGILGFPISAVANSANTSPMPSKSALSILHLSTAKTWRGGENQLLLLAKGLQRQGHQILIAAPKDSPLHHRAKDIEVPTRVLTIRGDVDPAGVYRLAKVLREMKPQILHLHDAHSVLAGQLAVRSCSKESIRVIAHRRTAFRIRSKWKYCGRVNRIIAISAAARDQVLAAARRPKSCSSVVRATSTSRGS